MVDEITAGGGTARAYTLDVTDKTAVEAVVAAVVVHFGRLDVLVNNAGLMPIRPMAEANTDEWDAMIDVNLKGTLYGIAAALPRILDQGSGHVPREMSIVWSAGSSVCFHKSKPIRASYAGTCLRSRSANRTCL